MITVFVENNDGTHDLFATVTDLNTAAPTIVLSNKRINRGNQEPVSVQEDGNGNCLLTIQTQSADDPNVIKMFNNQSSSANGIIPVDVF